MKFVQGRVFALNENEAAAKIRDKHNEYEGKLTVLGAWEYLEWYEYLLEVKE